MTTARTTEFFSPNTGILGVNPKPHGEQAPIGVPQRGGNSKGSFLENFFLPPLYIKNRSLGGPVAGVRATYVFSGWQM